MRLSCGSVNVSASGQQLYAQSLPTSPSYIMYDTETLLDRDFMRRMICAYEQDLLQLVNETPDHPGGDWAQEHLQMLELLRQQTFSPLKQSITF
jgi:hypothetical protein